MENIYYPTTEDLKKAATQFRENEPRDLFYRVATELIKLAISGETILKIPEALAVLLQTWNANYYRFRLFNEDHFQKLEKLITDSKWVIDTYRKRSILSLEQNERNKIEGIFKSFETLLGPVGASKSLHLLAPTFFPLWDRAIADNYDLTLGKVGTNATLYYEFMKIVRSQCQKLEGKLPPDTNPLKAIDEFNYCKFTKKGFEGSKIKDSLNEKS